MSAWKSDVKLHFKRSTHLFHHQKKHLEVPRQAAARHIFNSLLSVSIWC